MKKFFFNYLFFAIILCNVCNLSHAQSIDSAMLYTPPQFEYEGGLLSFVQAHLELNDKMFSQKGDTVKCSLLFSLSDSGVLQFDKSYEQFDKKTFCFSVYTMLKQSANLWKPALLGKKKINAVMGITFTVQYIDKEQNIIFTPEILLTDSSLQENAFYNEGTILLNDKKYNEAIPFLEKAIQINIKNVQSLYNLGICKLKLGDSVAACNLWWEIKAMNSKIANSVLVKYCLNRWEGTSEIANIESEHATDLDHTFTIVEQMPEFPGGEEFLISYIQSNFRYPKLMRERKVMGTVYLTFVVQYDGKIADIRILKGIPGGKELDEMAVQLVQNMPRWKPGRQHGKLVNVQFNLPLKCELKE